MPRVQPNEVKKFNLYKSIESNFVLDAAFRMRQCSIAEIPAQTRTGGWACALYRKSRDRSGDQDKNPSLFDRLSATQFSVVLNDITYLARDVIANFKKHRYAEYYKMFTEFAPDYYGVDPLAVSNSVDIITYQEEFPVFYFAVSKLNGRVSQSVVDIKIRMRFAENVWANVVAYALVISDRRLKFQSDGKKMNVIY